MFIFHVIVCIITAPPSLPSSPAKRGGSSVVYTPSAGASDSESSLAFLADLSLSQYAAIFDAEGYEAASNLEGMTLVELKGELGMKTGHAKKLLRYLATLCE
tara:strand:- start:3 stop:308 length:306 start_codon:yes stop_codon:yes gene_type:complete